MSPVVGASGESQIGTARSSLGGIGRVAALVVAGACLLGVVARPARATPVYTLFGTGAGADLSSTSGVDSHWNIVALPSGASGAGVSTPPYAANVPRQTPPAWLGGSQSGNPQSGYTVDGQTYYWISPSTTANSVVSGTTNWIAAQTFNVPSTGFYEFDFYASVDNELTFYIDGTLSAADPLKPTVVGGTQIGASLTGAGNFSSIHTIVGSVFLTAGSHTAYAVVTDWPNKTGVLISQSTFAAVPEIDPAGAGSIVALVTAALGIVERRGRRTREA